MKNNLKIEILASLVIVVLTALVLNPFHFWMPNMMHMVILALTLVAFAFFAIFILREKTQDERDTVHRMLSGRVAFLAGSTLLTVAIVVQALQDTVDPWLVVVLISMVFSKLITRIYSDSQL
jgi:4-amino-4-deoxy-L-arabinose transferase-like glycosyltransferase